MNMRPEPKLLVQPPQHTFEVNEDTKKASQTLKLTNPNPQYLFYFKIRTTGKARYVVKPTSGMVAPNSTLAVELVFTLPMGEDLSKPIYDKFVVYSKPGTKMISDRKRIEDYLTENMTTCDKFQCNAVALLAPASSGFKTSLNLAQAIRPVPSTTVTPPSLALTRKHLESAKESELADSDARSNNLSGFSKDEMVARMMESMKMKVSESLLSGGNPKPMARTLPINFSRRPTITTSEQTIGKSPLLKSSLFEAQFSNDVLFEKTNKMLTPDESENGQLPLKEMPTLFSFQKLSPDQTSETAKAEPVQSPPGGYQLWHVLLALIVGSILGAFLNG